VSLPARCGCGHPKGRHFDTSVPGVDIASCLRCDCASYSPIRSRPIPRSSKLVKCKCGHPKDRHAHGDSVCDFSGFCACYKYRPGRPSKPARSKRPRKQRKTGRAALGRLADKLCGQIVRARGVCEGCGGFGSQAVLQWAHGLSRRYHATRWNLLNSFCLCRSCHYRWTLRPLEFDEWLRDVWGQLVYDELRRIALKNEPVDLEATVAKLREELASQERSA
jgi:hypothetical protein